MASNENTSLPGAVKAALNHVLFQAFRPEGNVRVAGVHVCGRERFAHIVATLVNGEMISPNNWYVKGKLYILNTTIQSSDDFGPFTMDEIWKMPRIPTTNAVECLDFLSKSFPNVSPLQTSCCWVIPKAPNPRPYIDDCLPQTIQKTINFVMQNYKPELTICAGIIIAPLVVNRERYENDAIIVIERDGFYITMIKHGGYWFILRSCRTAFFENIDSWYIMYI